MTAARTEEPEGRRLLLVLLAVALLGSAVLFVLSVSVNGDAGLDREESTVLEPGPSRRAIAQQESPHSSAPGSADQPRDGEQEAQPLSQGRRPEPNAPAAVAGGHQVDPSGVEGVSTYTEAESKGVVRGRILYGGRSLPRGSENPESEPLDGGGGHIGTPGDLESRKYVISEGGGIGNCVIEIRVDGVKSEPSGRDVRLVQTARRFEPRVTLLPCGDAVEFVNSDDVEHRLRTFAQKNDLLQRALSPGESYRHVLRKPEPVPVKSDGFREMNAWIFVTDTPYATISDSEGYFRIEGLPPGEHRVDVWHEGLAKAQLNVFVRSDGSSDPVSVKLRDKRPGARLPR